MPSLDELEKMAITLSRQGDMRSTERVCRDILALDKNHLSSLRFLADLAIQSGDFATATAHLQTMREHSPADIQLLSQLGQLLYRQGMLEQAVSVYTDYWRLKPRSGMIYLTLGCLHLELGNVDKAAQVFSLGEAAEPELLSLWKNPDTSPAVARMSERAWDALRDHHTQLHLDAVGATAYGENVGRIRDAVWPLVDSRPLNYTHPLHRPQIFSIQYESAPAFFDVSQFPWREQLERKYQDIRKEVLAGMNIAADGRPYLRDSHRLEGAQWEHLVNKMSWASVHLYSRGAANQTVIKRFPETLAALAGLPLATTNGNPSEVFISVLAPHTRIPEHFGVSSAILTAHLPIEVPPGCGLKVHQETREPQAGKLMVFDDTWEHSAWNDSDQPRVVLIFELWHPELTGPEREAIARSLVARERWLRQRKVD